MMPEKNNVINNNQLRNSSNILTSMSTSHMPFNVAANQTATPPPLPPRQPVQNYSGYNSYRPLGLNNYYSNYGYGNNYRSYGGYGSFGMPYSNMSAYNNYGYSGDAENRFQQYAEESTRSTFRVVETVLHTFSSITMVLESTYFALTNSFRAILSVADNISKLRSTIGQLLSTFALIRFLKWIYRKILLMLGLQNSNAFDEDIWQQSVTKTPEITNGDRTTISSWTHILLLGVFVAIPYLIHKILNNVKKIEIKDTDPTEWVKCEDPVYIANSMYDFMAASNQELSLKARQKIWLAPQSLQPKNIPGWWMATDNTNVGLIPSNYVTIVGQLRKKSELEKDRNTTASLPTTIPTSTRNMTASDKQAENYVNTPDSYKITSQDEQDTDFLEKIY